MDDPIGHQPVAGHALEPVRIGGGQQGDLREAVRPPGDHAAENMGPGPAVILQEVENREVGKVAEAVDQALRSGRQVGRDGLCRRPGVPGREKAGGQAADRLQQGLKGFASIHGGSPP